MRRRLLFVGALVVAATLGAGCAGVRTNSAIVPSIRIDGSGALYPITEAVAEEFQNKNQDLRATVGISGTAEGLRRLCRGEVDVANAARPMNARELGECASSGVVFLEVPVAYDAVVVIVHPGNAWAGELSVTELSALWGAAAEGKVARWNQVRAEWPDREIHLYAARGVSDTMDYFAAAVLGANGAVRADHRSEQDDSAVAGRVAADELALGICDFSSFVQDERRLKALPVAAGGRSGAPTPDSVRSGAYQPLARPLFLYVSGKAMGRPEVKSFVDYYLKEGPWVTDQVGGIQLGDKGYELVRRRVAARVTGSIFGGEAPVGLTVERLLARLS